MKAQPRPQNLATALEAQGWPPRGQLARGAQGQLRDKPTTLEGSAGSLNPDTRTTAEDTEPQKGELREAVTGQCVTHGAGRGAPT